MLRYRAVNTLEYKNGIQNDLGKLNVVNPKQEHMNAGKTNVQ